VVQFNRFVPPNARSSPVIAFDVVRAALAVLVLLAHVRWTIFEPWHATETSVAGFLFYGMTSLGDDAVLAFFFLSGILVGGPAISAARADRFNALDYTGRRAARIVPPLLLAVVVAVAIEPAPIGQIAANLVGLNGILTDTLAANRPLWSIAYEIWFYIATAGVALYATRREAVGVLIIAAAATAFTILNPFFLAIFGAGALLARAAARAARKVNHILAPIARPAAWAADRSYSLYLFHYPVLVALGPWLPEEQALGLSSAFTFAAAALFVALACCGFHALAERHTPLMRALLEGKGRHATSLLPRRQERLAPLLPSDATRHRFLRQRSSEIPDSRAA
jgi:peptidoglycan/LPS O-acetylase OafA/YrhL